LAPEYTGLVHLQEIAVSPASHHALEASALAFTYPNQATPSFREVSLQVNAGERQLITGSSGCGKSTLARCLVGLIPHLYNGKLDGKVWLGDWRTDQTPLWRLAERAGMVLQNTQAQMLASTVEDEIAFGLENLGLPRAEIARRIEASLERFDLQQYRARDPRRLSGGEGQRVMLAAMLARRPPVLVLDEPLSMLDTTAAEDLVNHLSQLARQGSAVVVCEHRSHYFHQAGEFCEYALTRPDTGLAQDDAALAPISRVPHFDLSIDELSVNFGQRQILEKLSLELSGGQIVALVGVNGSGKTTLLRSLVGLQRHAGRVQVTAAARPDLGLVYQNPDLQLFNPTVREEILFRVNHPNEPLYQWLLTRLGLTRYEMDSPLLLSEGEKKRLCLAMVLMHQPRHGVLLDEPTLGQDDHHRIRLGRTVQGLAKAGRLVIVATHDLAWAAHYATRMLVLHEGRIMANGTPQMLLHDAQLWKRVNLRVPTWIWEPIT
jgi:energy-coupling factor transport system ATP-binding protein